jgi:hydroxyethylthiazole kinase
MSDQELTAGILRKLRLAKPVVHNITNYVTMNWAANCLLAVGASPVMAHAPEEIGDMLGIARSLVINIGTLSRGWIRSMELALKLAKGKNIPVVLDPAGAGASVFRTEVAGKLVPEYRPTVVRGNASEIMALNGDSHRTRGVDAADAAQSALDSARAIARGTGGVVCVTGAVDYVVEGKEARAVAGGHPIMARVTGMGCAASSLIAAFLAVQASARESAIGALTATGKAGELAAAKASGTGSFQTHYLDALSNF